MADDERPDEGTEDLFEDLDKFFEPIQDVGWPEDESDAAAPASPPPAAPPPADLPESDLPELDEPGDVEEPAVTSVEDTQTFVFSDDDATTGFEVDEVERTSVLEPADGEEHAFEEAIEVDDVEVIVDEEAGIVRIEDESLVEEIVEPGLGSFATGSEGEVEISDETEAAAEHFAPSVRTEPEDVEAAILSDLEAAGPDDEELVPVTAGDEGLQGPSWQEPTHEEVGEDSGQPLGRNVPAAFVTGAAMAAVAIISLLWNKDVFALLAGAVLVAAQAEFYAALRKRHYDPATAIGLVFGVLALAGAYLKGPDALLAMLALAFVFSVLWEMATPARFRHNVLANVALTMLGVIYIPGLAGFAMVLLSLSNGVELILAILALTFIYDTAAFIIGSLWGDTQLAPSISPRKSVQGAVAATVIVVGLSVAFVSGIDGVGFGGAAALAVIVSIFAPLGDLTESLFKRDLKIKDMGSILPGHGGILDRVDSVLLVAPAAFLLFRALFTG